MMTEDRKIKKENLLREIDEHERKIEELKRLVEEIDRESICANCGQELEEGTLFCPNCGSRILRPHTDNVQEGCCPQCGAAVSDGTKFCIRCGFALEPAVNREEAEKVQGAAGTVEKEAESNVPRICPKCGTQLEPDAMFCLNCGTKL